MKSVLFISRTYNDRYGGMQTYTKTLLRGFAECSDVHMSTCLYSGSVLFLPFFFVRALMAAMTTRADTVLLGDAVLSPLFFFLKIFRPRIKRVVIVYGLDLTWSFFGYRTVIRYALSFADNVVAISRFTAELVKDLGISEARIHVIPCPVSAPPTLDVVRLPQQILFLGRLIERKGVAWFLASVFPDLCRRFPNLTFVIAGDGPECPRMRELIQSQSLSGRVSLLGHVSEDEKWELLAESALLIVPNLHCEGDPEGFGIVCLEAGISGLPVVAARTDGLTDAVEEEVTGSFFEAGSVQDCAKVIEDALQKTWDREAMKATTILQFSPASIASRFCHDVF